MRNNAKLSLVRAIRRLSMDESLTLYTPPAGMRIAGRWAEGTAVTSAVTACVQVADGESKLILAEGLRTAEAIDVYALSGLAPLQREEGTRPCELLWRGKRYSVETVEDWSEHGLYWYALCSRVTQ